MKIAKVIIENFRCFDELEVTFDEQMTVLVAPNGAGKTTVLDAVRIALWPFVKGFDLGSQAGKAATIQIDDVRLRFIAQDMEPVLPAKIYAVPYPQSTRLQPWLQYREQIKTNTKVKSDANTTALTKEAKKYQAAVYKNTKMLHTDNMTLPLVVYLGTGRLWYQGRYTSETQDKKLDNSVFSRFWGYQNCLTATSNYKQFETWYAWVYRSYRELQIRQLEGNLKPQEQEALGSFSAAIQVVQTSINQLTHELTGWYDLQYRASMGQQLVMEHAEQGYIPLSLLSDGLRNMVAMISDIAFRCIKLNPHLGKNAATETSGIVLIDEVDMFLHPAWQQTVLNSLKNAFPKVQFIVTTHSAQVLSTVNSSSIRVLSKTVEGKAIAAEPASHTYGKPSNEVLLSVMQVDPQPPVEEKASLDELTELIDQGRWGSDETKHLFSKLSALLGENHPQLQRLKRSIERQKHLASFKEE